MKKIFVLLFYIFYISNSFSHTVASSRECIQLVDEIAFSNSYRLDEILLLELGVDKNKFLELKLSSEEARKLFSRSMESVRYRNNPAHVSDLFFKNLFANIDKLFNEFNKIDLLNLLNSIETSLYLSDIVREYNTRLLERIVKKLDFSIHSKIRLNKFQLSKILYATKFLNLNDNHNIFSYIGRRVLETDTPHQKQIMMQLLPPAYTNLLLHYGVGRISVTEESFHLWIKGVLGKNKYGVRPIDRLTINNLSSVLISLSNLKFDIPTKLFEEIQNSTLIPVTKDGRKKIFFADTARLSILIDKLSRSDVKISDEFVEFWFQSLFSFDKKSNVKKIYLYSPRDVSVSLKAFGLKDVKIPTHYIDKVLDSILEKNEKGISAIDKFKIIDVLDLSYALSLQSYNPSDKFKQKWIDLVGFNSPSLFTHSDFSPLDLYYIGSGLRYFDISESFSYSNLLLKYFLEKMNDKKNPYLDGSEIRVLVRLFDYFLESKLELPTPVLDSFLSSILKKFKYDNDLITFSQISKTLFLISNTENKELVAPFIEELVSELKFVLRRDLKNSTLKIPDRSLVNLLPYFNKMGKRSDFELFELWSDYLLKSQTSSSVFYDLDDKSLAILMIHLSSALKGQKIKNLDEIYLAWSNRVLEEDNGELYLSHFNNRELSNLIQSVSSLNVENRKNFAFNWVRFVTEKNEIGETRLDSFNMLDLLESMSSLGWLRLYPGKDFYENWFESFFRNLKIMEDNGRNLSLDEMTSLMAALESFKVIPPLKFMKKIEQRLLSDEIISDAKFLPKFLKIFSCYVAKNYRISKKLEGIIIVSLFFGNNFEKLDDTSVKMTLQSFSKMGIEVPQNFYKRFIHRFEMFVDQEKNDSRNLEMLYFMNLMSPENAYEFYLKEEDYFLSLLKSRIIDYETLFSFLRFYYYQKNVRGVDFPNININLFEKAPYKEKRNLNEQDTFFDAMIRFEKKNPNLELKYEYPLTEIGLVADLYVPSQKLLVFMEGRSQHIQNSSKDSFTRPKNLRDDEILKALGYQVLRINSFESSEDELFSIIEKNLIDNQNF